MATEDIGLADPQALTILILQLIRLTKSWEVLKEEAVFAQAVIYLSLAPKAMLYIQHIKNLAKPRQKSAISILPKKF